MDQAIRTGEVELWNDGIAGLIGMQSNFSTQHSIIPVFHYSM
jgi:hypothetical protein